MGCSGDRWFPETVLLTVGSALAGHLLQYTREQLTQVPWRERQGSVQASLWEGMGIPYLVPCVLLAKGLEPPHGTLLASLCSPY